MSSGAADDPVERSGEREARLVQYDGPDHGSAGVGPHAQARRPTMFLRGRRHDRQVVVEGTGPAAHLGEADPRVRRATGTYSPPTRSATRSSRALPAARSFAS